MRKPVFILLLTLTLFLGLFTLLEHEGFYRYTLGLVAKNWVNDDGGIRRERKPYEHPTSSNYIQWDGVHYQFIKVHGYDVERTGSDYIFAFFPLFPYLWRLTHLPPLGILFLNYLFFSGGLLWLLRLFSPPQHRVRDTLLALSLPGLIIFLLPYTEATYFLVVTLGIAGLMKERYGLYFAGFYLAALTRPSFTFLLLSLLATEGVFAVQYRSVWRLLKQVGLRILPLLLGTLTVSVIQLWQGSGDPLRFIKVQKYWSNVLGVPHGLSDWSHEGFGINIAVVFLIFVPLLTLLLRVIYRQLFLREERPFRASDPRDYLTLLSLFYLVGNTLFVLLFRGGSLHCLFRFTLVNPFAYLLLFSAFRHLQPVPLELRSFFFFTLVFTAFIVLILSNYSSHWSFSYTGFILMVLTLGLFLFQDHPATRLYRTLLYSTYGLNILWTTYLFNTYISNGWIFA